MIIGIHGCSGSGKDTIASYLVREYGYKKVAFADALKEEVLVCLRRTLKIITFSDERHGLLPNLPEDLKGFHITETAEDAWDRRLRYALWEERSPIVRSLLQEWGTEHRRPEDPDYWIKKCAILSHDSRIVVPDVRFRNEAFYIRRFSGIVIRVDRPGHENGVTAKDHASESGLGPFYYDAIFVNDGTVKELEQAVAAWLAANVNFFKVEPSWYPGT